MEKEELKKQIIEILEKMGCLDIVFRENINEGIIIVLFNCRNLTSFKGSFDNWIYSGIHLDPSNERQYKLDFKKI